MLHTISASNRTYKFYVDNPEDAIQGCHARGSFFEPKELEFISRHVKLGKPVIDIGANVGNHSIYLADNFPTCMVYPFEPFAEARAVLLRNVMANDLPNIDMRYCHLALSDREGLETMQRGGAADLGNSRLVSDVDYSTVKANRFKWFDRVTVMRGDDVLGGFREIGMIKIDVEGHEIHTLSGLVETLKRCRPLVFIEVRLDLADRFKQVLKSSGYSVRERLPAYNRIENWLLGPA